MMSYAGFSPVRNVLRSNEMVSLKVGFSNFHADNPLPLQVDSEDQLGRLSPPKRIGCKMLKAVENERPTPTSHMTHGYLLIGMAGWMPEDIKLT